MTPSLGQRLRAARQGRRLSLRTVAADTGIPLSFLSDIENDRKLPSQRVLEILAEYYELDPEKLRPLHGRIDAGLRLWVERTPGFRDLLQRVQESRATPTDVEHFLRPWLDGTMNNPIWSAAIALFENITPTAHDAGIGIIQTGPFDTKGPIWIVHRPSSPDVFIWAHRIRAVLAAFAGTADRPTMSVEFISPVVFDGEAWVGIDPNVTVAVGMVRALKEALDWADDHVPPYKHG